MPLEFVACPASPKKLHSSSTHSELFVEGSEQQAGAMKLQTCIVMVVMIHTAKRQLEMLSGPAGIW